LTVERAATPRLRDIIDAIDHIRSETVGVTLEEFEADWRRRWLVERGIRDRLRGQPPPVR
jgi:uncharacterized protein with HEPN domain